MNMQVVTPELREWIAAQAAAGHSAEVVVEAMRVSGWEEGVARSALAATLGEKTVAGMAAAAPARPLPGRHINVERPRVPAGDREVEVLMAISHPRVVVFGDLLSVEECAELIELASRRLSRSETVATRTGASEVNEARTSDGMFFLPGEFPVCARLEARLARLLDWPLENGEGLQILRYRPGTEYKPHYDYFDPAEPGTPAILKRGGQRLASIVCYLNTPEAGPRQCRLLQLRPAAPLHAHSPRRCAGPRRREMGRDQVDAGGPVRIAGWRGGQGAATANNPAVVSTVADRRR
jgi:prolyl 4-hydroxylase